MRRNFKLSKYDKLSTTSYVRRVKYDTLCTTSYVPQYINLSYNRELESIRPQLFFGGKGPRKRHPFDVFSHEVKFEVHMGPDPVPLHDRMREGVGNDRHDESVFPHPGDRQADAVDGHRADGDDVL